MLILEGVELTEEEDEEELVGGRLGGSGMNFGVGGKILIGGGR